MPLRFFKFFAFVNLIFLSFLSLFAMQRIMFYSMIEDAYQNDIQKKGSAFLFHPSPNLWQKLKENSFHHDKPLIALISLDGLGDYFSALNIQQGINHDLYDSFVLLLPRDPEALNALKSFHEFFFRLLSPDLSIFFHDIALEDAKKNAYLMISDPDLFRMDFEERQERLLSSYSSYQGYLIAGNQQHQQTVAQALPKSDELYFQYFYHTGEPLSSLSLPQIKGIFHCGALWDKLRSSPEYFESYRYLDHHVPMSFYGSKNWQEIVTSYKGFLPFEREIFLKSMHQEGITLVLHSQSHFEANMLSARIFEAVAAKTLVISDPMPMVQEIFGDSVLYLDLKSSVTLGEQIEQYYLWAKEHPDEAWQKIEQSYRIYSQHYLANQQMSQLLEARLPKKF